MSIKDIVAQITDNGLLPEEYEALLTALDEQAEALHEGLSARYMEDYPLHAEKFFTLSPSGDKQ